MTSKIFLLAFSIVGFSLFASSANAKPKPININPCAQLSETPHLLSIEMGDSSCDGHCLKQEVLVCGNRTQKDLSSLYELGSKTLGFDVSQEVEEYEDSTIKASHLKKLYSLGVPMLFEDEIEYTEKEFIRLEDKAEVSIGTEQFLFIYLGVVKIAQKDFEYKLVNLGPTLNIGGYGLFFH